jgi:hypothetical protein
VPPAPDPEPVGPLVEAGDALDRAVVVVLKTLAERADRGYESESEARLAVLLIVRHVEGVAMLARSGVPMFPAAMTLARAAYEAGLRTLWLLDPDDPFEREGRWLTHLSDSERYYQSIADALSRVGEDEGARRVRDVVDAHREFRLGVEGRLPAGIGAPLQRLPSLKDIVTELGREERYLVYRMASQYAHATHVGTGLYRRNLGVYVTLGEYIHAGMWRTPLQLSWFALEAPAARLVECLGGNARAFTEELPLRAHRAAVESLPTDKIGTEVASPDRKTD